MARKEDRQRAAKRARRLAPEHATELYEVPADADVDEHVTPVTLLCGCRIVQRIQYFYTRIVFFAIVWVEDDGSGGWREKYSCDSGHGWFHEHTRGHAQPGDRRDLKPLYTQVDVQECFDPAYDLVQNRHDSYCRKEPV